MDRNLLFARVVLVWVFGGHLVTGLVALLATDETIRMGSAMYGAAFEPTAQFRYIIKPLGAFMLGLAFLQFRALLDPRRNRAVIDATIFVLLLRQYQRIFFAEEIYSAFGVVPADHWARTAMFLVTALLLVFVRVRLTALASERATS